ncbi:MAG: AI-2E family transporter [Candidatus Taylorbacteria bacterium]|nr:AI-2E family transporter [Candidatus Taylorbacteria bacterium]
MDKEKLQSHFFLALLLFALTLSYFIFEPFLTALILATIAAVVFRPLYKKVLSYMKSNRGMASFITIVLLSIFVLTPLFFIGSQIFHETRGLYTSVASGSAKNTLTGFAQQTTTYTHTWFPALNTSSLPVEINSWFGKIVGWIVAQLGSIFSSILKIIASLFIFLITLYYFFKDGKKIVSELVVISPLADTDDLVILKKLDRAIHSSITGSLTIGIIQGILAGIGFTFFGIPNPVLWGTVTAVAALIPGVGTALVITPAVAYLFITGNTTLGIGLAIWGAVAVGLVDNFLGPRLIGREMELPPLIIFLSVLGGILFFGPLGFILGPVTLNLLFALLEIYSRPLRTSPKKA